MFEAAVLQIYGPDLHRFPTSAFPARLVHAGNVQVSLLQLVILGVSILLTVALELCLLRSGLGRAIRAVAENRKAAQVLGIDVDRIILLSFVISSGLGGIAGVLFALAFNGVDPAIGHAIELKGLAVIILGGMGSVPGAVLGGYLLGLTEVATVVRLGSPYRDAAAFIVIFLILMLRPRGLLGRKAVREA